MRDAMGGADRASADTFPRTNRSWRRVGSGQTNQVVESDARFSDACFPLPLSNKIQKPYQWLALLSTSACVE